MSFLMPPLMLPFKFIIFYVGNYKRFNDFLHSDRSEKSEKFGEIFGININYLYFLLLLIY